MAPAPGRPRKETDVIDLVDDDVNVGEDVIDLCSDEEDPIPPRSAVPLWNRHTLSRAATTSTRSELGRAAGTGIGAQVGCGSSRRILTSASNNDDQTREVPRWLERAQSQARSQTQTSSQSQARPQANAHTTAHAQSSSQPQNRATDRPLGTSLLMEMNTSATGLSQAYHLKFGPSFPGKQCDATNCRSEMYRRANDGVTYCERGHKRKAAPLTQEKTTTSAAPAEHLTSKTARTNVPVQGHRQSSARAGSSDRMPALVPNDGPRHSTRPSQHTSNPRRSKPPVRLGTSAMPLEIPDSSSDTSEPNEVQIVSDSDEVQVVSPHFPAGKRVSEISASMRGLRTSRPITASRHEIASPSLESPVIHNELPASSTERNPASLAERVARVLSEADKRSATGKVTGPRAKVVEQTKAMGQESAMQQDENTTSTSLLSAQSDRPSIMTEPIARAHDPVVILPIMARTSSLGLAQASPGRMSSPGKRKRVEHPDGTPPRQNTPMQRNTSKFGDQGLKDDGSRDEQTESLATPLVTINVPHEHQAHGDMRAQHLTPFKEQEHAGLTTAISANSNASTREYAPTQAQPAEISVAQENPDLRRPISHEQPMPRKKACAIKTTASPFARRRPTASNSRRVSATSTPVGPSPLLHSTKVVRPDTSKSDRKAQGDSVESSDEDNLLSESFLSKRRRKRISTSSSSLSSLPADMRGAAKPDISMINAASDLRTRRFAKDNTKIGDNDVRVLPDRATGSLRLGGSYTTDEPKFTTPLFGNQTSLENEVKWAHVTLKSHVSQFIEDHDYFIKSKLSLNRKRSTVNHLPLTAKAYRQSSSPFLELGGVEDKANRHDQRPSTFVLSKQALTKPLYTGQPRTHITVSKYSSKVPEIPKYEYYDRAGSNQLTRNHLCLPVIPNYVAANAKEDAFEKDLHPENPYRDGLFHWHAGPAKLQRDRFVFLKNLQESRQLYSSIERFLEKSGCSLYAVLGVFLRALKKDSAPNLEALKRLRRAEQETQFLSRPVEDYRYLLPLLPTSTQNEYVAAVAACKAFEDEFGYSIWLIAEQKARTLREDQAPSRDMDHAKLLCRICFAYNCSKHGKYFNGGSASDKVKSDTKDSTPTWDAGRVNIKQQVHSTQHRLEKVEDASNSSNIRRPRSRHSKTPGSSPETLKKSAISISVRPDDGYRCSHLCSLDRKAMSAAPPQDIEQTLRTFSAAEQARGRFFFAAFRENLYVSCMVSKILGKSCNQVFWLIENLFGYDQANTSADKSLPMGLKAKTKCGDVSKSHLHNNRKIFYPCNHEGDCESAQCQCFRDKVHCEKSCGCTKSCGRRFPGCKCTRSGKACREKKQCLCWSMERECDPDLCGTCGAVEVLDPMRRHMPDVAIGRCANVAIQLARPARLIVGDSQVAGFGLYAGENIKAGQYLGEYQGELISYDELSRREDIYRYRDRLFTFRLNRDQGIDGEHVSNKLRFINNSLKDHIINCAPEKKSCNTIPRIAMFATKNLRPGDELFFNYGYKKKHIKDFLDFGKNGLERVVPKKAAAAVDAEESSEDDDTSEDSDASLEDSSGHNNTEGKATQPVVAKSNKQAHKQPVPKAKQKAADPLHSYLLPNVEHSLNKAPAAEIDDDSDAWIDDANLHAFQQRRDHSSDDDYEDAYDDDSADAEISGRGSAKRRKASFLTRSRTSANSTTPMRASSRGEDLSETSALRGRRSRRGVLQFDKELFDGSRQSPRTRGRRRRGPSESADRTEGSGQGVDISSVRPTQRGSWRRSLLRENWHGDDESETRTPSESTGKRKKVLEM